MNDEIKAPQLEPSREELIIRMYRTGLGDCFLLAVGTNNGPRYLLIDCGIHRLQENGFERMAQVMKDLADSTRSDTDGKSNLHVVVGTHEHADHLSGIVHKQSPFLDNQISIEQLWLAWTENPRIPQARRLRQKHGTARKIIRKAVKEAQQKAQNAFALSPVDRKKMSDFAEQLENDADLFEKPDEKLFDEAQAAKVEKFFEDLKNLPAETIAELKLRREMGVNTEDSALGATVVESAKPSSNELALGVLVALAEETLYCKPGEMLEIPGVPKDEVRVWVLAPPRDEQRLKKDKPSKVRGGDEHDFKEVYLSGLNAARSLEKSPLMMGADVETYDDNNSFRRQRVFGAGLYPFHESVTNERNFGKLEQRFKEAFKQNVKEEFERLLKQKLAADSKADKNALLDEVLATVIGSDFELSIQEELKTELKQEFADFSGKKATKKKSSSVADHDDEYEIFGDLYFDRELNWRRIDNEWLENAETLALNLDSDTNNTSLVLAIELGKPGEGPVLLFPGDAQVGNWLSWRDQTYKTGQVEMTADDLLRRTLVYKVGHHGSHNATVKCDPGETNDTFPAGVPFGLELMDNIIAMIPTHRKSANKAKGWEMPYKKLYQALREKADHRVLRSDSILEPLEESADPDIVPKQPTFESIPRMFGEIEWRRSQETFDFESATPEEKQEPLYYEIKIKL